MADQINMSPGGGTNTTTERVIDRTDNGGMSGLVWAILILLILVIGYFLLYGRGDNGTVDNNVNITPQENAGTTQPQDTGGTGTGTQTQTETNPGTTTQP